MNRSYGLLLLTVAAMLLAGACSRGPAPVDEKSLRDLYSAYVEAWLKDDTAEQEKAVLALFSRDAVIMPGGGLPPAEGLKSLREFWFPDGGGPTKVTHFTHEIDSVDVAAPIGVVSGRYTMSFAHEGQSVTQAGNYMIVAVQAGGGWRIKRMIWNDAPLTEV